MKKGMQSAVAIAVALIAGMSGGTAEAADGYWTNNGNGAWSDVNNWQDGIVAGGADFTAYFTLNITAARTVDVDVAHSIGHVTFADTTTASSDLRISGGNSLTLDVTSGSPVIDVSNRTLTVSCGIAGSDGLTKAGAGTLALLGTNTYSGGTVLNAGRLTVGADNNLGDSAGGITFNGSAYLLLSADFATSRGITLNNATGQITGPVALRTFTVNGAVTGDGVILLGAGNSPTALNLTNTGNTFAGSIFIGNPTRANVGSMGYRLTVASLADTARPITFGYANTAPGQGHEQTFVWAGPSALVLNNRYFEFGPVAAATNYGSGMIESANANASNTLVITTDVVVSGTGDNTSKYLTLKGGNTGSNTFAGRIVDGTNTPIVLLKAGNGMWVLSGSNTYSGGTTLSNGTLHAAAASALGTGSVTVIIGMLVIDAADAMADSAALRLPSATTTNLTMNADDAVNSLYVGAVQQPPGVYTSAGAGSGWMVGSGTLTVLPEPAAAVAAIALALWAVRRHPSR